MGMSVLYVKLLPSAITEITRVFEGYEHLALVSTVDRETGIVKLQGTPDTLPDVVEVVHNLPFNVENLDNFSE